MACHRSRFFTGSFAALRQLARTQPWIQRLMVIGGEIIIARDGKAETFRRGDTCAVPANYPHAEKVGPQGVALIAGRKAV